MPFSCHVTLPPEAWLRVFLVHITFFSVLKVKGIARPHWLVLFYLVPLNEPPEPLPRKVGSWGRVTVTTRSAHGLVYIGEPSLGRGS